MDKIELSQEDSTQEDVTIQGTEHSVFESQGTTSIEDWAEKEAAVFATNGIRNTAR